MIWNDVDTALAEVPVNAVPLTDDTDFKTLKTSVAYNASGLALYWHFYTPAGAYTVTQVTPTTGGSYDWAHQAQGMYTIEIPASGGASINNDTEGWGRFTGVATGVLPWVGPWIGFRAAALNNALIEGGSNLEVTLVDGSLDADKFDGSTALPLTSTLADRIDASISSRSTLDGSGVQSAMTSQGYTTTRAGYQDKLNVSGTLAHSDAADTYKATGFAVAGDAMTLSGDLTEEMKASVNTEVLDVLNTDTFGEPTGAPGATVSLVEKLGRLYMALRNRIDVTADAKSFYDDDGNVEWVKGLSDDGTTYTETEGTTP